MDQQPTRERQGAAAEVARPTPGPVAQIKGQTQQDIKAGEELGPGELDMVHECRAKRQENREQLDPAVAAGCAATEEKTSREGARQIEEEEGELNDRKGRS